MKITIDCDEEEILIDDQFSESGYVQIGIHAKNADARFTTVDPGELIRALEAFIL